MPGSFRLRLWPVVVIVLLATGYGGLAQDEALTLGNSRTVVLEAGTARSLTFDALAAGFVRLAIDRDSPGIKVRVLSPDGTPLDLHARVRAQPAQHLFFLTQTAGAHRIEFSLEPGASVKRSATARLLEVRGAIAEDTPRIAADDLASEAAALQSQNVAERRAAIAKLEQSLPLWRAAGDVRGEADAHNRAGGIYYQLGDFKASLAAHQLAVPLFERAGDLALVAEALGNQAVALQNLGEAALAAETHSRVLAIQRQAGNKRGEAYALHNLGAALYRLGRFEDALARYEEALAAKRAIGDNTLGVTTSNMGTTRGRLGDYRGALATYQEALALRRASNDRRGEAYELQNLGSTYVALDEWPAALEHLLAAVPVFEAIGDARGHAQVLHNLGVAYEATADYDRALSYLDRALTERRTIGDPAATSTTLMRIGTIAQTRADFVKARATLTEALALKQQAKDQYGEAYVRTALARLDLATGDPAAALGHVRASVDLSRSLKDRSGLASALNELGHVLAGRASHEDAIAALRESIALQPVVQTRRTEADSRYLLARSELARGNLEAARQESVRALDIIEGLRPQASGGDARSRFVASRQSYYDLAIDVLMQIDRTSPGGASAHRAFEISERARATRLLDTLAVGRVDIREGVDAALLSREQQLARDVDARETARARLVTDNANADAVAAVTTSIARAVAELADVRDRIRAASPRYASLLLPTARNVSEIQALLDPDTVLLEFWLGDERSYLWSVSRTAVRTSVLPSRQVIESAVRSFHGLLTARQTTVLGESLAASRARIASADTASIAAAARLSTLLLSSLATAQESRWVIVADGALEYLPFGALPDPSSRGGTTAPAMVRHQIVSAPSATAVGLMRADRSSRIPATRRVAILADPVFSVDDGRVKSNAAAAGPARKPDAPDADIAAVKRSIDEVGLGALPRLTFSRDEAAAIAKLVPADQRFEAMDFLANRATVLGETIRDYRVLHLATHALLNNEHPELSGVVLSLVDPAGQPQNGFLRLHELYNLKLGAELVVLSACQTALGSEMRGEGLQSVARGFMYSGASNVLATLWRVDDRATSELMTRFYRQLLQQNLTPAAALQAAAAELAKDPRWRAPYYWAAFTLQGEWK
jgi:CHAT domain-containing protein/tetratricopeptide (TPR) repeat protein